MKYPPSDRVQSIGSYAFAEVSRRVDELKADGVDVIDFGVGDPTIPTPELIRTALKKGVDTHAAAGYPPYIGWSEYRIAVAAWMKRRFGLEVDPETEIMSTIGSKEAVFNFAESYVNPGDVVLIPSPGYPPYTRGTLFAEGESYHLGITEENDYLIDFESIPDDIAKKAKILWINYPNSPTGKVAPDDFFERVIEFSRKYGIIVASDEAYSEIYYTETPPRSILEFSREGVIAFYSMSKRSAMTGYRIGWAAGDPEIISTFKKVKTNIDSGTPFFVQEAAIAALADEEHVKAMRDDYRTKRDILTCALNRVGLENSTPDGTLYIWQKCPAGMDGVQFATALLSPDIACVVTPGEWISDELADGTNPGAGYVRFALVPGVERCKEAADRLGALKL